MPWVVISVVLAVVGLLVLAALAVPVVREIRRLAAAVGTASTRLDQAAAGLRAAGARLDGFGDPGRRAAAPPPDDDGPQSETAAAGDPVALPAMRRPEVPASPVSHPYGVSS